MCTVSWRFQDGGYELFCNRDETRARALASPPRRCDQNGVAYLSPKDGDAGGTWVAANELGLAVCLLNRYPDPLGGTFTSRGWLVRELAEEGTVDEVLSRLLQLEDGAGQDRLGHDNLGPFYRPFTLLALQPEVPPLVVAWDGQRLLPQVGAAVPPLSSSSFDPSGIGEIRRQLWLEILGSEVPGRQPSTEGLMAFHRSHVPERGPLSPCMHRDDARTVSMTRVRVTRSAVEMAYADGPPCCVELSQPLTLIRQPLRSPVLRHVAPVV